MSAHVTSGTSTMVSRREDGLLVCHAKNTHTTAKGGGGAEKQCWRTKNTAFLSLDEDHGSKPREIPTENEGDINYTHNRRENKKKKRGATKRAKFQSQASTHIRTSRALTKWSLVTSRLESTSASRSESTSTSCDFCGNGYRYGYVYTARSFCGSQVENKCARGKKSNERII